MPRPSLALCMIVKNEEAHLPRLFETFKNCFDEIHITDTGSTDKTVEIAKSLGAQVHHFEWCNDFAAARNYSFSHAKTDFIMWLDADDALINPEAFIAFRNDIMDISDFWIAKYDYTSDSVTGKSLCSFARERVVRKSKQLQWMYPIHEGITPISPAGVVKQNYVGSWYVKHVRTSEDLIKDKSRNLTIFESFKDKLDPRMRYYYGKELFEAGKPVEAASHLLKAASEKNLELHDRVLAIQYACYSYMACSQFESIIDIAHQGIALAPHRAELYCILGDAYLKLGKISEAIPAFSAAKSCTLLPSNAPTAIFSHETSYTDYPRNQLARIYANLGELDKAYLEAKECDEKYPNKDSKAIKEEIAKIKISLVSYEPAKACDDIVISCPPAGTYKWDPVLAQSRHMGGSETAAMEMAHHLARLSGRKVKIFNDRDEGLQYDGVEYIPVKELTGYFASHKPYFHVSWRHNAKLTNAPTFVWCHDLFVPNAQNSDIYSRILALSPFHKKYLMSMFGIDEKKIFVTRNGIKPERFKYDPVTKNPNKVIFSSSPDRGLDRTIRVLDRARSKYQDLELHVFYGMEQLPKYGRQKQYDMLKAMMDERPWVKYHGGVDQNTLMQHMRESVLWVYPTDFLETSCITAMEMVGNGVYPIVRNFGALPDTLSQANEQGMASIIDSDCTTEAEINIYSDEVIKALDEKAWERVKFDMDKLSWMNVAKDWLNEFPKMF